MTEGVQAMHEGQPAETTNAGRVELPTKKDPKTLKDEPLSMTEDSAGYINKQIKKQGAV